MMPMVESMIAMPMSVLVRFGLNDESAARRSRRRPAGRWPPGGTSPAASRSRAPEKPDEAAAERKALDATLATVPEQSLFGGTGLESAKTVIALADMVLDARIAWARGARDRSVASSGRRP